MEEEKKSGKGKEYFSAQETIKNLLLCIFLLIIGFLSIIFAQYIGIQSLWFVILLTIGITFLVSLTTVGVEYILRRRNIELTKSFFTRLENRSEEMIERLRERIEEKTKVTEEKIDRIGRKLELAGKLNGSGIIDIFPDRWDHEEEYHNKIKEYLHEYADQIKSGKFMEKEIGIMGIALRFFFKIEKYTKELKALVELGVKFRVLLLDPESEAALERSKIESPEIYKPDYLEGFTDEEKENYDLFFDTAMFKELHEVHEYIVDNPPPWIETFDIRYYKNDPSYYSIKFLDKLIIESYHYGSIKECDIPSDRFDKPNPFIGGRIPIFVYDFECITYRLISNHFDQIWRRSATTPKDKNLFFKRSYQKRLDQLENRKKIATL